MNNRKYAFTRGEVEDDDGGAAFLQGRCKDEGKSSQGVIVYSTLSAIIVGVHDLAYSNGASFGKVNTDIGRVADYMHENGFQSSSRWKAENFQDVKFTFCNLGTYRTVQYSS